MAGEWTTLRLGSVCSKIGSGATPRGGSSVYLENGSIALIRSQNVRNDALYRDGLVYLSKQHAAELSNVAVEEGDVLLNITGDSVARACQVNPAILPARVNQHVAIIRPDATRLSPQFLRYFLVSPTIQAEMLSLAGAGATRNALTKSMIESFEVFAPADVREQFAIAHILGTLDDKIELNRRTNETLEAIARTIFKSWFVDFDPVRAKAEGRDPSLPEHVADLFPDRFEDSELGEIPAGWKVMPIGEAVQVVGGGTPSTKESAFWEGGMHRWATPRDLSKLQDPILLDTERKVTDAGLAKISSGLLPVGTVLLSSRAPVGYLAVARVPVSVNQGFIAMVCEGPLTNHYVLHWALSNMEKIEGRASGTTFQEISKKSFRPMLALVPTRAVLSAFEAQVAPLYDEVTANLQQSRTVAAIRDALLPKLISGELRMPGSYRIKRHV